MNRKKQLRGNFMLLITAIIWGIAFVAQKSGGDALGPLTCNGLRSLICAAGLTAALPVMDRTGLSHRPQDKIEKKRLLCGGALCGLFMFIATNLQQMGINVPGMTEGKSAFITALYIVLVPLLGLFLHKRVSLPTWLGVVLAAAGLYLLCAQGETGLGRGDWLLLGSALAFAVQILLVDRLAPTVDGVRLSRMQFLVVGLLNLPLMLWIERPSLAIIGAHIPELLYLGLMSSGVGYTLQILGQKDTNPTTASLLMSLESVFGALAGWLIGGRGMSAPEWLGCGLMFAAIVLAQLPSPVRKRGNEA